MLNSAVILLDKDGKILADYDPSNAGVDQIRHDFTALMTDNLADSRDHGGQGAVAGKTGFANDPHRRTGVLQSIGYTHLKGALGYPGMNWSVLVAVDHAHATADARAINRNVLIAIIVCLVIHSADRHPHRTSRSPRNQPGQSRRRRSWPVAPSTLVSR